MNDPRGVSLTLADLLIQPIQRLPRYKLLFDQLKKVTPEDHTDYQQITTACEKIDEVCLQINEKKGTLDRMGEVIKVQKNLTGNFMNLVSPTRQFIKQEEAQVTGSINRKKLNKDLTLFLFSDLLVFTEPEFQEKFSCIGIIFLKDCEKGEIQDSMFTIKHKGESITFNLIPPKQASDWSSLLESLETSKQIPEQQQEQPKVPVSSTIEWVRAKPRGNSLSSYITQNKRGIQ